MAVRQLLLKRCSDVLTLKINKGQFSVTVLSQLGKMKYFLPLVFLSFVSGYVYETKWYTVPVDHFSYSVKDTFKLRYLVNVENWNADAKGPIFFYTGNEGDIEMFANNTGFMWDIAKDFQAMVVFAEHRYYGKSLPYGNNSYTDPKNLGFLSSSQALADYADLITYLQKSNSKSKAKTYPVIAFGGSYGGMLSAWFRMKYPYIVDGAIAASAPILQFTGMVPCDAFNRIVTSDFGAISPECPKKIRESWKAITRLTSKDEGMKWLSANWTLCSPLKSDKNVTLLKEWLAEVYTNAAMLNYPYPTNFLLPLPAYPVLEICSKLIANVPKNKTDPDQDKALLMSLFSAISTYFNHTGKTKCLDVNENDSDALMDKGWDYQSCTEMVMPMCSTGEFDMFEAKKWDLGKEAERCKERWGTDPKPYQAEMLYGGRKALPYASKIIFSNGMLDPWASGGVLKAGPKGSDIIAVTIPEGAHHLDLRESNPSDPASVVQARKIHVQYIKKWIKAARSRP
ncbi:hypothetical protein J437_LFUL009668 [Ladona fulva]|uniref:Lysosomal Pro-X carboxypeptidase n=1 Tax=Ladona fulva TaxID=123851 RepID=A0A8K0K6Q9_LADFU|nr:hypothetical protein J437_LFUL009668 [Ladona fulva]